MSFGIHEFLLYSFVCWHVRLKLIFTKINSTIEIIVTEILKNMHLFDFNTYNCAKRNFCTHSDFPQTSICFLTQNSGPLCRDILYRACYLKFQLHWHSYRDGLSNVVVMRILNNIGRVTSAWVLSSAPNLNALYDLDVTFAIPLFKSWTIRFNVVRITKFCLKREFNTWLDQSKSWFDKYRMKAFVVFR